MTAWSPPVPVLPLLLPPLPLPLPLAPPPLLELALPLLEPMWPLLDPLWPLLDPVPPLPEPVLLPASPPSGPVGLPAELLQATIAASRVIQEKRENEKRGVSGLIPECCTTAPAVAITHTDDSGYHVAQRR
jgi:hypothetical protein